MNKINMLSSPCLFFPKSEIFLFGSFWYQWEVKQSDDDNILQHDWVDCFASIETFFHTKSQPGCDEPVSRCFQRFNSIKPSVPEVKSSQKWNSFYDPCLSWKPSFHSTGVLLTLTGLMHLCQKSILTGVSQVIGHHFISERKRNIIYLF